MFKVNFLLVLLFFSTSCVNNIIPVASNSSAPNSSSSNSSNKVTDSGSSAGSEESAQTEPANTNSKNTNAVNDEIFEAKGTIDGQPVIIRIFELKRNNNDIVTLRVKVINKGTDKISGVKLYAATSESYLTDTEQQKKYSVVRDKLYNPLSSDLGAGIAAGDSLDQFAQFTAPSLTTTAMTVYFAGASPVADVPISQ